MKPPEAESVGVGILTGGYGSSRNYDGSIQAADQSLPVS